MVENNDTLKRGKLLIEDLPTVLQKEGREFLNIKINHNNKIIESNLHDEILLGDDKFDPFQVLNMMDKVAAMVSFWSTVLADINEMIEDEKIKHAIMDSRVRNIISKRIISIRTTSKAPSAAEIETLYNISVLPKNQTEDMIKEHFPGSGGALFKLYTYLQKTKDELKELNKKQIVITIVKDAWREKGYSLKSHSDLLITMINHNLIKIPEQRRVYENW